MQPVPVFSFNGLNIDVPADLPEGGHLCVIVGQNPAAIPTVSVHIPPGSMVGIIPPHIAEHIRPVIAAAIEQLERQRAAPGGLLQ